MKILFLGTRPLGKRVLEFLLKCSDVDVIGVVEPKDKNCYWNENPTDLSVNILPDDQNVLKDIPCDLLISVNYDKIIRGPLLGSPRLGCVNIHHSHNLRIRGRHSATHAILLARSTNVWIHGSSLHYISPELDAGKIISSKSCVIEETDTAFTLFNKCENIAYSLIEQSLPLLLGGGIESYEPSKDFFVFRKKVLPSKQVDLSLTPLEIYDYVRALTFPPFEPPYMISGEKKRFLTIEKTPLLFLNAGKNRCVYFK